MILSINSQRYRQIILFLAIFQSYGIRLFSGIGILLSFAILCLCFIFVRPNWKYTLPIIIFSAVFLFIKSTPLIFILNCEMMIFNSFLIIEIYKQYDFSKDFYSVLNFFFIHSLLGFFLTIIIPDFLWININASVPTQTLGYIFFRPTDAILIDNVRRLMGLAWEPGCMQMLLNLLLFLKIKNKENIKSLIVVILAIILTGSTVGYLILIVNLLFYFKYNKLKKLANTMWFIIPLAIILYPFIEANITEKMSISSTGSMNSSGLIRYRDIYVGLSCLLRNPLLGIDMSDLTNNQLYTQYEYEAIDSITGFADSWYRYFDYAAGGYTNGIFTITMMWGIIGIFMLYNFIKCKIWYKYFDNYWIFLPIIFCLTFMSEPITNTVFFYFFTFYNLFDREKKINTTTDN